MNFELADRLTKLVEKNDLNQAIEIAENELKKIPETDFHKVIGRDLPHLVTDLQNYIRAFDLITRDLINRKQGLFKSLFGQKKVIVPAAYYCEMNGFTINYDRWFIDLFSYERYSSNDWDWLSDFYDSSDAAMTITGLEDIQKAFQDVHENERFDEPNVIKAYQVCELLVILRLQELFKDAYIGVSEQWSKIPIFITAHDYDIIYKVQ